MKITAIQTAIEEVEDAEPGASDGSKQREIAAKARAELTAIMLDKLLTNDIIRTLFYCLLDKGDTYEDGWHMYGCPAADMHEGKCSERCQRDRAAMARAIGINPVTKKPAICPLCDADGGHDTGCANGARRDD